MLHTWLAESFRHHGPRAVPILQTVISSCRVFTQCSRVSTRFSGPYPPTINALTQVRSAFVSSKHANTANAKLKSTPVTVVVVALWSVQSQPVLKPAILSQGKCLAKKAKRG